MNKENKKKKKKKKNTKKTQKKNCGQVYVCPEGGGVGGRGFN